MAASVTAVVDKDLEAPVSAQVRRAQLFVTALWGESLTVEPGLPPGESGPQLRDPHRLTCPAFESNEAARAAAAHAGAHHVFGGRPFPADGLKARQRVLIELFEDARVEALAVKHFPGLSRLWRSQLPAPDDTALDFDNLVARLAQALLDPNYHDTDDWVSKGQRCFFAESHRWSDPALAYELGMLLASDLGQMRIAMNEGRSFSLAPYRDDNAHLWREDRALAESDADSAGLDRVGSRSARLREDGTGMVLGIADATRGADGDGFSLETVSQDAPLEYREEDARDEARAASCYPEWDYRIQCLKSEWVTVLEESAAGGDDTVVTHTLQTNRAVVDELHRQIGAVRYESHRRLRRQLEGDELDPDGLIGNAIDLRSHRTPDQRIYVRHHVHSEQELAALVLLDLSASTNDSVSGDPGRSVLDVTRDAAIVLSDALSRLGHHFAIHGFNSDGRHALHYRRLVDFDEPFGREQRGRFDGICGEYSTRMGAAIRHATACLTAQPAEHRLLLVITDGEPSDIDVYDRRLLVEDARHAVFATSGTGVVPFCLSLDARADEYVAHIFGPARYTVLEQVADLPQRLPSIYFRLARRYLA